MDGCLVFWIPGLSHQAWQIFPTRPRFYLNWSQMIRARRVRVQTPRQPKPIVALSHTLIRFGTLFIDSLIR